MTTPDTMDHKAEAVLAGYQKQIDAQYGVGFYLVLGYPPRDTSKEGLEHTYGNYITEDTELIILALGRDRVVCASRIPASIDEHN